MLLDDQTLITSFFNELADKAGSIALQYFRAALAVEEKSDRSPVTRADREIEQALRLMIANKFPSHGVIGEEYGKDRPEAPFVWVIDPIDGTRAFMTGKPLFGSIIGLLHEGQPVVGIIDSPFTKDRWLGVADQWATHNGKPINAAAPRTLAMARLYIGYPSLNNEAHLAQYLELCRTARWTQYACDCYAYGLAAMGWADIVVEDKLALHDAIGIAPIITGAGGFISDWSLKPVGMDFSGNLIAASNKNLAEEALAIIN